MVCPLRLSRPDEAPRSPLLQKARGTPVCHIQLAIDRRTFAPHTRRRTLRRHTPPNRVRKVGQNGRNRSSLGAEDPHTRRSELPMRVRTRFPASHAPLATLFCFAEFAKRHSFSRSQ